uniref:Serine/threonine-protein phosphatase n=1 Tax=Heliothis virescens TaxID=7102 RepID=A0A2A4J6N0_HELVI
MYSEFVQMVFPAIYMSVSIFTQFMIDLGWQRAQCPNLFRAADITGRGGLSFLELMLWSAALEPGTQHSGVPAEIRCRYIFRYFDGNRDLKLEYVEFKELVAAARAARQLPIDALSVAKDADVCLRQLGMQPNSQLPLAEFLRGVGELRLRGTSSLLRASRSISAYIVDLQERDKHTPASTSAAAKISAGTEDAVSPSTANILINAVQSFDVLGPSCMPVEALAAVHYFASTIERPHKKCAGQEDESNRNDHFIPTSFGKPYQRRPSGGSSLNMVKPAWAWNSPAEEVALGSLLLRLAEAVKPICANEPRLLRLTSPVYAVGDLHGNLGALLTMESALWPSGSALSAARLLFLGDFVDRGAHGTELMAYLLAAKLQRPDAVLMVRGNHETRDIQKMFTFYNECIVKYGDLEGTKIWNAINNVFDVLPLAAVIDDKVFCCHGGIPPPWVCPLISAIDKVPVPLTRPAEQSSIAWELLWNDPIKLSS